MTTVLDARTPRPLRRNPSSLARLVIRYVDERRHLGEIGKQTCGQYTSRLLDFARTTEVSAGDVNRRHVLRWLEQDGLSAAYRRARLTTLRGFCEWCVLNGYMRRDPTVGIRPPKLPPVLPRYMNLDESSDLMDIASEDSRTRLACLLMLQEGLRRSEVAGIQLGDIDRSKRILAVRGKGGGGGITRRLPITDETWRALAMYLVEVGQSSGPLFRNRRPCFSDRGVTGATIGDMVTAAMKRAGVKQYPWDGRSAHALRHTCAQDLVDLGVDLRKVQKVLGHASIRNTELYTRGEVTGLREVMDGRNYRRGQATAIGT